MGRLIDADELKKDYPHDSDWEYPVNTNEYVCESIDNAPTVEAIPKDQYEARLKADLKAVLVELQLEIKELEPLCNECDYAIDDCTSKAKVNVIIQQKINELKENKNEI